jgi:hypothetical protein
VNIAVISSGKESAMTTRKKAAHRAGVFVEKAFPIIPLVPIGVLLGSLALAVVAFVRAGRLAAQLEQPHPT